MRFSGIVHSIFFALIFAPITAFLTPLVVALFWVLIITTWTGIQPLQLGEWGFLCVSAAIGFIFFIWVFFFSKEKISEYDSPFYYKILFLLIYGISLILAVQLYFELGS